jgi:hypothetical protein
VDAVLDDELLTEAVIDELSDDSATELELELRGLLGVDELLPPLLPQADNRLSRNNVVIIFMANLAT